MIGVMVMREFKFRAWINLYSHWHMTNEVQYVDDKTLECNLKIIGNIYQNLELVQV